MTVSPRLKRTLRFLAPQFYAGADWLQAKESGRHRRSSMSRSSRFSLPGPAFDLLLILTCGLLALACLLV